MNTLVRVGLVAALLLIVSCTTYHVTSEPSGARIVYPPPFGGQPLVTPCDVTPWANCGGGVRRIAVQWTDGVLSDWKLLVQTNLFFIQQTSGRAAEIPASTIQRAEDEGPNLPKPNWKAEGIAIADIAVTGFSQDESRTMTEWFQGSIEETKYFKPVSRTDMTTILKEQQFPRLGSCDDSQCLVEMGKILTVHKIIGGTMGRVGDRIVFIARLVDVETGEVKCTAKRTTGENGEKLLNMISTVAIALCDEYGKEKRE